MAEFNSKKSKTAVCIFILLTSVIISFSLLHSAKAETKISITPTLGNVGTLVQLNGNISTPNGRYIVKFDEIEITSGNATEHTVNATFTVPNTFKGSHNVTLIDDTTEESDTTLFTVTTSYSLKVSPEITPPAQLQEGDFVQIILNITGGEKGELYTANITVQDPSNTTYSTTEPINVTTSEYGNATRELTFPSDFENANTSYVGEYKIFFNTTLAQETFFIGLTNSTEYHRHQVVDIKAIGYNEKENVTITISKGEETLHSETINATSEGKIYANWAVPSNATIGIYTLNITSTFGNTTKNPPDIQNFIVPGFDVNVTTTNLADEPVPNVIVNAFENVTLAANETSNVEGIVFLKLEIGNYTLEAYYKNQKVGVFLIEVTNATALSFPCNLTNLRIHVIGIVEGTETQMPEVNLFLKPENQTATTNITGTAVFHSLLPNVSYTINASRYNIPFNVTTIPTLFVNENAVAWYNITIRYPSFTLKVEVLNPNANNQPINNATVKIQELITGLYYERKTNESGKAVFDSLLGKYKIEVYEENGIKLNETSFELFEDKNLTIYCNLYGLVIKVKVIDYFGQPISNVNVKLRYCETVKLNLTFSNRTQGDGVATFTNIVGGDMQAMQAYIYLTDQTQPYVVKTFSVKKSTTVVIKIEKYVVLAGLLVETSQLAITILIVATVILVLLLEIYRKKRVKPREAGTENKG